MGKKKITQTVLGVLMILVLLIGMLPGVALADDENLGRLEFVSSSDSTLITGVTSTINIRLYQYLTSLDTFSGPVVAYITDPEGNDTYYTISGSSGSYSIPNVTLDTPGNYTLTVTADTGNSGSVNRTLRVVNAVASVTGSLYINTDNTLTGKFADADGNALLRKDITIDGSTVGATSQTVTTLSDGTFSFTMTPTLYGTVNIKYGGHIVGTIPVVPAYTQSTRIGGSAGDNVAVAIEVAKNGWTGGAHNVILSRDDQFSDTMSAVPLSKILDAPILMTNSSTLDPRTSDEIRALGATNVYIVGGTVAVSQAIQNSLASQYTVTRIAGLQGYDTAAQISTYVGGQSSGTVYLANGNAIPDAISASAFAAEQRNAILLTDRDTLPSSTLKALSDLNASNVVLLGGTAVIGSQVENQLRSKYSVERWGGYDRYDTQNIIFENLFNTAPSTPQSPLYFTSGLVRKDDVSSGKPHADALLTAALAAKTGGFVAMLPQNNLPMSLYYFLIYNKGYIPKATVVGNYSAVSHDSEQQIQQILQR